MKRSTTSMTQHALLLLCGGLALGFAACGDDPNMHSSASLEPVLRTDPIALASTAGCQIDSDCVSGRFCFQSQCVQECEDDAACGDDATCSPRGRCVDTTAAQERAAQHRDDETPFLDDEAISLAATAQGEIGVKRPLPAVVDVHDGEQSVRLTLETAQPVPQGRILYRVELDGFERDDDVRIAKGTDTFEIDIPTGVASGTADDIMGTIQFVNVITSVGAFNLTLRPKVTQSGIYEGEVMMEAFGSGGLPIQIGIRLTPPDATFEDAVTRELLLPVRGTALFTPEFSAANTAERWLSRPLEYDAVARVWAARFANPFLLLPDMLFGQRDNIVRTIRVEIDGIEGNHIVGAIADRWEGLYAERSADGVTQMAPVRMSGRMTLERVGRLSAEANDSQRSEDSYPTPPIPPAAVADACSQELWSSIYQRVGNESDENFPCELLQNVEDLPFANSERVAACVEAGAAVALSGPTTAKVIRAFLDPQQDNPGDLSFQEFLSRCAAQDGYCVPSDEVACMVQLVAGAYQRYDFEQASDPAAAQEDVAILLDYYQQLSRETYLGMELSAYQRDTQTRLDWLRTTIAPLFLAADLRTYNNDMMVKWERDVLQAHYNTMTRQYGPADLEVLARVPTAGAAQSARRALLLELTQSWQGTMDALVLASQRWNELYSADTKREQAASKVQRRMLELYLSAGVLSQLNSSAGSSVNNTQFGSGFSNLASSLDKLNQSFNDLLFYRDAEVVVSHSVDPTQNAQTLLKDKETLARQAIADAQSSIDRVLNDAHMDELDEALLRDSMQTQLESLRSELVNLCGVPHNCETQDVGVREGCEVPTAYGGCGTGYNNLQLDGRDFDESLLLASDAGKAILAVRSAIVNIQTVEEEYRAASERVRIQMANAFAFEENLERWNTRRQQVNAEIAHTLADIERLKSDQLAQTVAKLTQIQTLRDTAYKTQAASVAKWYKLEIDGNEDDYSDVTDINWKRMQAANLQAGADTADSLADVLAEGVDSPLKLAFLLPGFAINTALTFAAVSQEHEANKLTAQLEYEQAMRASKVTHLRSLAELDAQLSENQIQKIADDMRVMDLKTSAEISARETLMDGLRRSLEADLAYEADLQELRDRQSSIQQKVIELAAYTTQITQAEIGLRQRVLAYETIVQRAQLLEGRFSALNTRAQNLDQLIGSPAVIFAFANRLASSEARLERAKTLTFDWLVALEYYAVRPFADQRVAITLARNPSQLEAIANDLLRLQRVCGGLVNYETVDVSVRDHFLQMNRAVNMSLEDGEAIILQPAERFRALLQRGNIPLSTQTRYTADERIGDLINNRRVLAVNFPIRLADFANLPQTCNAKVASVAVQLVGEALDDSLFPVVSVLYDGTSELTSCQPNIQDLVGALDPGATAFDLVTRFRTAGRSVSPVARVNAYGPDSTENRGLEGLPLSSTYTLLIDPNKGDNRSVDWGAMDDIRLKITYAYQDVFPEGQCQ